jgi:hypothetical protein
MDSCWICPATEGRWKPCHSTGEKDAGSGKESLSGVGVALGEAVAEAGGADDDGVEGVPVHEVKRTTVRAAADSKPIRDGFDP